MTGLGSRPDQDRADRCRLPVPCLVRTTAPAAAPPSSSNAKRRLPQSPRDGVAEAPAGLEKVHWLAASSGARLGASLGKDYRSSRRTWLLRSPPHRNWCSTSRPPVHRSRVIVPETASWAAARLRSLGWRHGFGSFSMQKRVINGCWPGRALRSRSPSCRRHAAVLPAHTRLIRVGSARGPFPGA
jgi:hypothetical protein